MSVNTSMPPALFEVEPTRREVIRTPHGTPYTSWGDELCGMCRRPMRNLPWSHGCGGADRDGRYVLCDNCACDDLTPDGRPRWGITHEYLAIERLRRKVYAAGGGETEVHAALVKAGLVKEPTDA